MQMHHTSVTFEQPVLSDKEREQQTSMIMQLFKHWQLTNSERALILGLSPRTGTSINNYNTGKAYLPQYRDIQDRVGHLFAIHRYLKRAYPYNTELAYRWIKTPNFDFQQHTPLEIIVNEGFAGLLRVRNYLASDLE